MDKLYYILLAIVLLPAFLFCDTWYVDCNVTQSGNGTSAEEAFQTIQEAINCQSLAENDTILILPGTYFEEIYINTGAPDSLTICSNYFFTGNENYIDTTIIDGDNAYYGIHLSGPKGYTIDGFTITDCYINSYAHAAGITIGNSAYGSNDTVIRNCIIANCVNNGNGGGAIRIYKGANILIDSCTIENNINDNLNGHILGAGGIFIHGQAVCYNLEIRNSIIRNNSDGGIYLSNLSSEYVDVLTVINSLICDNTISDIGGDGAGIDLDYSSLEMNFCTIINNVCEDSNEREHGISQTISDNNYKNISNSIILDTSTFYDEADDYDIIRYCGHLDDDNMEPYPAQINQGNFETTASEAFVSGDDLYHLCWDSPCIDAGDPDNDGDFENWLFDEDDQDSDGSRLSIGYAAYEDQDRWEYEDGDIVWMSFPKLPCSDGVNNGDQIYASTVFERFLETTIPDSIFVWQERDIGLSPNFTGIYNYFSGEYNWSSVNYSFNSTDGLKIKIRDNFDPINPLIVGGLSCELNTSLTVTTEAGDVNWVGYFVPYKMNVMDAFYETTLDSLTAIKTHDWSLYKIHGEWFGSYPPGGPTLYYGDMLELYTNASSDFSFYWRTFGTSGGDYERKETQYFSYEEELDYQSIFVELGEEKPDEIAVYIDGVCKGAEVVDVDSLLEIRAYIMEEPQGQEIEIVTASGRVVPSKVDYKVVIEGGQRKDGSIFTDRRKLYQIVSLELGEEVPEPKKVLTCYPNPFNPELTIEFFTTESTENTEITIYNIKGQKVRKLVNTVVSTGEHSVVWQGKDDKGNQVSSGVYFIRMQIGQQVYTGKAVLMK
ncbi:MAG: FlgD immunoglobulin-like domain containing protein [Candidatus Stygibacter australis]|nr:FlgD immunoglobulin-like domain containing protein [Candidatus Stygibacter australis]